MKRRPRPQDVTDPALAMALARRHERKAVRLRGRYDRPCPYCGGRDGQVHGARCLPLRHARLAHDYWVQRDKLTGVARPPTTFLGMPLCGRDRLMQCGYHHPREPHLSNILRSSNPIQVSWNALAIARRPTTARAQRRVIRAHAAQKVR